jgi:uncharacterized protein (DUF362 family)
MSKITRRQFITWISTLTGAVVMDQFLSACSQAEDIPVILNKTDFPANQVGEAPATQQPKTEKASNQSNVPELVVARGDHPEEMVRQAIAALGGIERFVPQGANVVIKPNICVSYHTYEYAATTNPWVVAALVKLCLEAGAKTVKVMDNPFGGTPEEAYARSGIQEQVTAAGGELISMTPIKFRAEKIPSGLSLTKAAIYDDILQADVLINVPIAKHHSLARLTLGMKNLMGAIKDRPVIHSDLGQRLADLSSRIYPTLTIIDAIRMLMNHGPTGGNLDDVKQANTVIASPDIVAADSYAATLFGLQPNDLEYIRSGTAMGLGRSDLANLRIEEINVTP